MNPDNHTSLRIKCNQGAVVAKSIGRFGNCYTSQLIVTIGEEMINGQLNAFKIILYLL